MTDQNSLSVLQRMTQKAAQVPQDVPLTSSRAVRVAVTRAADIAEGLTVNVQGLQEKVVGHDGIADAIEPDWLIIGLHRDAALVGLIGASPDLRSAVLEMQTTGAIGDSAADDRAPTNTDAMLMTPFLATVLKQLAITTPRTDLDGWTDGVCVDARVSSARSAGLGMEDCDYRVIRLTVDLGAGEREGALALLLPAGPRAIVELVTPATGIPWDPGFRKAVSGASASLTAVLHEMDMPLSVVDGFQVGQVLSLPGCTLTSVSLTDPNGRVAAKAQLGQYAGMRAVKLTLGHQIEMSEIQARPNRSDMMIAPAADADAIAPNTG
ncbi:flagellar motor switch protein FliM [Yoonia sp. 208BN28-4]|uniref:flagellar motor switch protein FliM n=1 Tax=Yoonia sp. 208BN28-4 TaxID=3126505 RepID=UPI0030AB772B